MAIAQAVATAALVGGALTADKNGGTASSKHEIVCSVKPRSILMHCGGQVYRSSLLGSSVKRNSSRNSNAALRSKPVDCAAVANEVAVDNSHVNSVTKLETAPVVEEIKLKTPEDSPAEPTPEAPISAFMADVANLVKLVDSRDIVELELKHKGIEIIIRKETPQPPPQTMTFPGPHVMAHTPFPGYAPPPPPPTPAPTAAAPELASVAAAAPAPPAKPSHPPMLSPMAGTFYRSPGPGEPAFVQVGDQVTKGQVVCIVEAMKLMNEIEVDQSGTIVEILAEDGKPISMESPLFVIKP